MRARSCDVRGVTARPLLRPGARPEHGAGQHWGRAGTWAVAGWSPVTGRPLGWIVWSPMCPQHNLQPHDAKCISFLYPCQQQSKFSAFSATFHIRSGSLQTAMQWSIVACYSFPKLTQNKTFGNPQSCSCCAMKWSSSASQPPAITSLSTLLPLYCHPLQHYYKQRIFLLNNKYFCLHLLYNLK